MSFSVYLLFWMYPITEPLKKEKKNELKRTLTHLFVLILKELYICNWSGKAFYYLFIYLLKLIPNLKSGIQSEFFFPLAIFFSSFLYNFLQKDILIKNCIMLSLIQIWIVNKAFPKQIFYLCFYFKKIFLFFKSIFL